MVLLSEGDDLDVPGAGAKIFGQCDQPLFISTEVFDQVFSYLRFPEGSRNQPHKRSYELHYLRCVGAAMGCSQEQSGGDRLIDSIVSRFFVVRPHDSLKISLHQDSESTYPFHHEPSHAVADENDRPAGFFVTPPSTSKSLQQ